VRGRTPDERGSVSAELAIALPAVVLALMIGAGALGASAQQVLLQDSVADAARLLGRGESAASAQAVVLAAVGDARVSTSERGDLSCVTARTEAAITPLLRIPLTASGCALSGGR